MSHENMPKIGEGFSMPLQVLTGNLGNGNMGSIGPQSPEDAQSVLEASTSDKYEKTPSGHWGWLMVVVVSKRY